MVNLFRKVALAEGTSFLLLLFIAMPLKYMAGMPEAVKYVGWVHGILFIAFVGMLFKVSDERNWSPRTLIHGLAAGVLPFGTFVFDRKYLAPAATTPAP